MTRTEAAHRNGLLSRGPKTEAGKAISSQNARKHGITSNKMFVLHNENPEAWKEMHSAAIEAFRPTSTFEEKIVEEIAFAKWRLRRMWYIHNGLFDLEMDEQADAFAETYHQDDEPARQTLAFRAMADNSQALSLAGAYETRLQRAYDRAVRNLTDLRRQQEKENDKRTGREHEEQA